MPVSDATRQQVLARFPAFAWLLDNAELADLLQRAVDAEWTADTFEANLRSTQWWRAQSDVQRQRQSVEMTDPATAATQVNALKAKMVASSASLGSKLTDDRAGALAWVAWRNGWSDQQVRAAIAAETTPSAGGMASVRSLARAYMVDLDDASAADLTRRVFAGELDQAAVETMLADQAMSRFPSLANYIKQGVRPSEFMAPYRQMIANATGRDPNTIDLMNDPTWSRVVSYADGSTLRPMTLDETMRYVRSSSEFANSSVGQAEQAQFVRKFAQAVGAMTGA